MPLAKQNLPIIQTAPKPTKKQELVPTKILTIHHCAKEISKSRVNGKTVAINTNSQATLQTLSSIQVYSKALDQLCRQNRSNLEDIEGMNRLTY